jgi:nucleoside-diphosphate-sugar epimerase
LDGEGDEEMNILLMGATGFIGRNLLDFYSANPYNKILALGRNKVIKDAENVKYDHCDLRKNDDVQCAFGAADEYFDDAYIVIQAAATTSGSKDITSTPWIHVTDNALMNSLILREEMNHPVSHHVFFSCSAIYSGQHGFVSAYSTNIKEIDRPYFGIGWTKIYIEKMCEFFSRVSETKYICIRHTNVYGPYDKFDLEHSHFLGATITKIMNAKDGDDIIVWGDGRDSRDFVYVDDLCRFVDETLKAETMGKSEILDFASGDTHTTNDVVKMIARLAGKRLRILNDQSAPSIPIDFWMSKNDFATTYFEDGLTKTIEWWKKNVGKQTN